MIKFHASDKMNYFFLSSIVNEGIRAILNHFIIFFTRRFHIDKRHKMHKNYKKHKKPKNYKKYKKCKKH